MLTTEQLSILLINEDDKEIKQTAHSFRGFFPNCRIEAAHSLEEALQWAHQAAWQLILIDERLHVKSGGSFFPKLKRFAPHATVVLQSDRSDTATALSALQNGADFLLYKKSPAFLTELILYAKGTLEMRTLRMTLERIHERHSRLIDILPNVLYELDAGGKFVSLSPSVTALLGYDQAELIGAPYSIVLPPDQLNRMRHCFHERRTGLRASRWVAVELLRKPSAGIAESSRVKAEISAEGLYDAERRFFGTVGLLRAVPRDHIQKPQCEPPEWRSSDLNRLSALAQRVSALTRNLPLISEESHGRSQFARMLHRKIPGGKPTDSLLDHPDEGVRLAEKFVQAPAKTEPPRETVNDIIHAVLSSGPPSLLHTDAVEVSYAQHLPPFSGDAESLRRLLSILLSHALRHLAAMSTPQRLRISTAALDQQGQRINQDSSPLPSLVPSEIEICFQGTDSIATPVDSPIQAAGDLVEAYALLERLGARLDFHAPSGSFLSITLWIRAAAGTGNAPPPSRQLSVCDPPVTLTPDAEAPAPPASALPPTQPSRSMRDQRPFNRTPINVPVRLIIDNHLKIGTVIDLSPHGVELEIEGVLPSLERRLFTIIFKTAASNLELQAIGHDRIDTSRTTAPHRQTSRLALLFHRLDKNQQKMLMSFSEEMRVGRLALTVEAAWSATESTTPPGATIVDIERRGTDHRETLRVPVSWPIGMRPARPQAETSWRAGHIINLSRGGACLQTSIPIGVVGDTLLLHFASTGVLSEPKLPEADAPESILIGRIIHMAAYHVPWPTPQNQSDPGLSFGVRFIKVTPSAERTVTRIIAQHIRSSLNLTDLTAGPSILSIAREYRKTCGQIIRMTEDHAKHRIFPDAPIVLVVPGFGSTQTDYLALSYHLAANRFRVIRYDHTNHVGQSDGEIVDLTLRSMQTDLESVLNFLHATWPTAPVAVLAEDVGARVALKVMAERSTPVRLFLLNPVFDMGEVLSTLIRPNISGTNFQTAREQIGQLWGFNINANRFISDAIEANYLDSSSSAIEFSRLKPLPVILTSPQTQCPRRSVFAHQARLLRAIGNDPVIVPLPTFVSGDSCVYDERRTTAFRTICNILSASLAAVTPLSVPMPGPSIQILEHQRRIEHERILVHRHVSQVTREDLWMAHLQHLPYLAHIPEYWRLINDLYCRLLPLTPGMTILDVGCGGGEFARALLINQAYRSAHDIGRPNQPLGYIGLDRSHDFLKLASAQTFTFAQETAGAGRTSISPAQLMTMQWLQADWSSPFPFPDDTIHRVLCHLSLSFSPSPLEYLRQTFRILHQGGIAVITCFQPHSDLLAIIQRDREAASNRASLASTRIPLHFFGRLREAIRHGVLYHYERREFARLLAFAGAGSITMYTVLDGHLLLAVVQKTKSTG